MKARKFSIDEDEERVLQMNITEFIAYYESIKTTTFRNALSKIYFGIDGTVSQGRVAKVYYSETAADKKQTSLSEDMLREIISNTAITDLIIISELPLSAVSSKNLASLLSYNSTQSFIYDELVNDPTKHYLTSEHILLTKAEEREFLRKNRLNKSQIPRISLFDPICKWCGGRIGDIFKLVRTNVSYESIVPISLSYRVVVDIPLQKD